MFGKLFAKKKAEAIEDAELPETGPVEDAQAIAGAVDYFILRAAWDEYVTIKKRDEDYQYGDSTPTPCWKALEKVIGYAGDFGKFTAEEQHLLRALRKGFLIYDDVLHILIDHHSDAEAAQDLYKKYPQIHEHVPAQYDNPAQVIGVLVEVVRDYQWQLEHFSMKHGQAIDAALNPERAHEIAHHAVALPDAHAGAYDGKESYLSDAELGIAPAQSPMAERIANSVLDKLEVMEASLATEVKREIKSGGSVLDQEELKALAEQGDVPAESAPKVSSVLDADELKKLQEG